MAAMGHQGKRWLWRRSGVLSLTLWATSRWPPALIISFVEILSHPLVHTPTAFSKGQQGCDHVTTQPKTFTTWPVGEDVCNAGIAERTMGGWSLEVRRLEMKCALCLTSLEVSGSHL